MGLNVKLDVGLYRLDQQVACQRYRQYILDATSKIGAKLATLRDSFVATFVSPRPLAVNLI
jgi:hypothetical protein